MGLRLISGIRTSKWFCIVFNEFIPCSVEFLRHFASSIRSRAGFTNDIGAIFFPGSFSPFSNEYITLFRAYMSLFIRMALEFCVYPGPRRGTNKYDTAVLIFFFLRNVLAHRCPCIFLKVKFSQPSMCLHCTAVDHPCKKNH